MSDQPTGVLVFTCVFLQRLGGVRSVNNGDELLKDQVDILLHIRPWHKIIKKA